MKTLHRIDFFVQILILITAIGSLPFAPLIAFVAFFIGLGCWQPFMALVFAIGQWPRVIRERKYYVYILLALILFSLPWLLFYNDFDDSYNWGYLYTIIPIGFIMGIWNFTIAYREFNRASSEHQVWDLE